MIELDGLSLSIEDVVRVAERREPDVRIAESAKAAVAASRALVEQWVAEGKTIYGITTGFGEFANVRIDNAQLRELQQNLLRSHSAGVGPPLSPEVVRAMILLRANALAKGCSGVRLVVIERLLELLKADALPVIPSRGSVGSSGDLSPLAHLALALTGEGHVKLHGILMSAAAALKEACIEPLRLEAKEGLALINGTQMMSAIGCLGVALAEKLAGLADLSAAMSFEALRATDRPFDPRIHEARPHAGQKFVAARMLKLIEGSEIRESHRDDDPRVQDAYSLRCIPQVHGAVRDTVAFVRRTLEIEINSATDNPLIIGDHLEGGNFHGEPLALALDYLAIAVSELANISERRTERMVNGALSGGLPRFLTPSGGLNSGYMIAQYTAAALVSENKVYAHPASVDSIPTSANQEDHNSMGSIAAFKLRSVLDNVERVIAIEMLVAAQGIDFLKPLKPGKSSGKAHQIVRAKVPMLTNDRNISEDMAAVVDLVQSDAFDALL